jgi:hypothetical protein
MDLEKKKKKKKTLRRKKEEKSGQLFDTFQCVAFVAYEDIAETTHLK